MGAWLPRIDRSYAVHFDHVIEQAGPHSGKLNHLAIEISHEAQESDLIMFLDGDAFPIADPMPLIADGLARAPLIAVRRAENLDDRQPHPCFCATTIGAWRRLGGDWSEGYLWPDRGGKPVTDVGGNLLRTLELTGTPWVEVLRSNRKNPDPLFFAVVDVATQRAMGMASFMRFVPEHGVIEIGHIWFAPALQRTRQATEAIFLLARNAFDVLGYRRLEWKCDALNEQSRRAAERFGFTFEGVFRQHMVVKDRNRDTAWFSITDGEWPLRRAAFEAWLSPDNFDQSGLQRESLSALRALLERDSQRDQE